MRRLNRHKHCFAHPEGWVALIFQSLVFVLSMVILTGCDNFGFLGFNKGGTDVTSNRAVPSNIALVTPARILAGSCVALSIESRGASGDRQLILENLKYSLSTINVQGQEEQNSFYSDENCSKPLREGAIRARTLGATPFIRHNQAETLSLRLVVEEIRIGEWQTEIFASGATFAGFEGPSEITAGDCAKFQVKITDALGNPASLNQSARVTLSEGFFSDSSCVSELSELDLQPNSSPPSVYFRSTTAGLIGLTIAGGGLRAEPSRVSIGAGAPAKLGLKGPFLLSANQCSALFSLEQQDAFGNTSAIGTSNTVNIQVLDGDGQPSQARLYANADCSEEKSDFRMNAGESVVQFYLQDQKVELLRFSASLNGVAPVETVIRIVSSGSLDLGFGVNGRRVYSLGTGVSATVKAVRIQSTGRIVVAGTRQQGSNVDFYVVRFLADGAIDTSFGNGGVRVTNLGSRDVANAMTILSDNRIVVAGVTGVGSNRNSAIVVYTANGNLDTSFSGDGILVTDLGGDDGVNAVLTAGSRIYIAGFSRLSTHYDFLVARYFFNGNLDSGFSGDGIQRIDFNSTNDIAYAITSDSTGDIVLAGYSSGTLSRDFAVTRLNSNGSFDNSFGGNGRVTTDFGLNNNDVAMSVQTDSNRRVLVGGVLRIGTNDFMVVKRYLANGLSDTAFGDRVPASSLRTGQSIVSYGENNNGQINALLLQANRLLGVGFTEQVGTGNDFSLFRYQTDGLPDNTFGSSGRVSTSVVNGLDEAHAVVIQNGLILVAGVSRSASGELAIALLRFLP